jgi:hypothetical protein
MKKTITFAIATILLAAAAAPVYAYTLLSPTRRWANTPISVPCNNTGNDTITDSDGGVTAVVGAIRAWGIISSSSTSAEAVRGQAPATISLHTNGKLCNGTCLAATLIGYYHQSGGSYVIDDADVYTNQKFDFTSSREGDGCSGEFDIDGIMVHEVGHVIGLGHSTVNGATMYPSVGRCDFGPRSLSADDTAGKNALY